MIKKDKILLIARMVMVAFIFEIGSICLGSIEKAEAAEKYYYADVVTKIQDYYKLRSDESIPSENSSDEYTNKARLIVILRMQAMREMLDVVNHDNDDVSNVNALPAMMDDILEKYDKKQMLEAIMAQEPTDEVIDSYKHIIKLMDTADSLDAELWMAKEFLAKRVISENTDQWGRPNNRDDISDRRGQASGWDAVGSFGTSSNVRLGDADDYIDFGNELADVMKKVKKEMKKQIKINKKQNK